MRMSCNGCRVLRKGCSDDCSIRPCLQWIKSPESQANATVFLAKFYGRAGLMNLINAGPDHLRPAIFRSLLYEACGRIVNPTYGSVGLLWSGSWQLCQNAVEAVLKGAPITQISSDSADHGPLLKAYDIRHISKEENSPVSGEIHRVRARGRFKRTGTKANKKSGRGLARSGEEESDHEENRRSSTSHESSLSHQSAAAAATEEDESRMAETASGGVGAEQEDGPLSGEEAVEGEVELELTLGFEPVTRNRSPSPRKEKGMECGGDPCDDGGCDMMELRLDVQG